MADDITENKSDGSDGSGDNNVGGRSAEEETGKAEQEKDKSIGLESIKSKIEKLNKEFDAKAKEYDFKTAEYNKFKNQRLEELSQLQGAYKALNELLHAN